jgi:hypothetical protein
MMNYPLQSEFAIFYKRNYKKLENEVNFFNIEEKADYGAQAEATIKNYEFQNFYTLKNLLLMNLENFFYSVQNNKYKTLNNLSCC